MKKSLLICCLFLSGLFTVQAQNDIRFTVSVSTDSVLMGNPFQVQFTVENTEVRDFEAPSFSPDFMVVSGPNQSTSITMVNGQTRQSTSYSYLLDPVGVGSFFIGPATVETDLGYLETNPMEILVVPNPDGIKQPIRSPLGMQEFQFGNPNDFFQEFGFGDFEQFMMPFGENFENGFFMDPDSLMKNFKFEWNGESLEGMPFGPEFFMSPDSLMNGFPFEWDGESLEGMPFDEEFFQQWGLDSLQSSPFRKFFNEEFDVEQFKKMFPNIPEEYWQQLDPANKKKRKTFKM